MSYQAEGGAEMLGSAAGLDQRRVRGDLERFKELVESRGAESGAWRGEVSAGTTKYRRWSVRLRRAPRVLRKRSPSAQAESFGGGELDRLS
jgi:hypothetical protein